MNKLVWCIAGFLFSGIVLPGSILGQEIKGTMEEVVVTASRLEEQVKYSPDSITVITKEEIQKAGKETVIDVLRETPGVYISQNGKFGGSASIFLRGTNNAHTLIMIDGIKVGDPMATDGRISISDLPTDNIERIEVIRGAQSVLYGSDAIGGVINIITKKGKGKPAVSFSAEAGSFETFRENLGVRGANDKVSYAASVSRLDTKGVSKAAEDLGNTEQDYYHNTNFSARLNAKLTEKLKAGFMASHSESSMDYDNPGVDADKVQDTDITTVSTNLDHDILDWWQQIIKLGATQTKREYTANGAFDSTYKGTIKSASWQHNFFLKDVDVLTAGFDYLEESGDSQSLWGNISEKKVDTRSFFIQNKLTPLQGLSVTLGARHDDHETAGGENTYKAALAYFFDPTGTKIRGSYGTGFHAPSLYQLYSAFGDRNLKPEESKGYDIGLEQELLNRKVLISITYFETDIEDLIDWNWVTWKYYNVGKAETKGWETAVSYKPLDWLSVDLNYTYTDAKDRTPGGANEGKYLIYRPKHKASASVNIKPSEKLNLNINAQHVGRRYRNANNADEMPAYTLLNLFATYDLTKNLQLFGRVDNVTDKNYESIYQYGEPGIGVYGGIRVNF